MKDKDGNVIATSNGNARVIDRIYASSRNGQDVQITVQLKEVTIYTDADTPVQAYQAVKAYVADKINENEYGPRQEIGLTKSMKANCHGYTFEDGQVWFIDDTKDGSEFAKVLRDEYNEVSEPEAGVAVIEWDSPADFVRAHSGKRNKDGTYDHKNEMWKPISGDSKDGFMSGHDSGNGIYKVGTKYYQRKTGEETKVKLPKISVNGVRIVDED